MVPLLLCIDNGLYLEEILVNIPESFYNSMKDLLGNEIDDFCISLMDEPLCGLRVNTNKISVDEFVKIAPYGISKIPFIENGFYVNENDAWSKHPYYFAGLYYLQEPSAMLPASRLPITKGDKILDLCAAPGGKSTELATKGGSLLVSNDISYKRTIPLVKNLEIAGADNIYVTCEDGVVLSNYFPEFFDKILIDAPCSGEGMFRKDKALIDAYVEKGPEDYAPIQESILDNAVKMLKPGGYILYSTCTFSDLEDESVINKVLNKHEDLSLCSIRDYEGFSHGYSKYTDENSELNKCIHVFPHKMKGEGHFLALICKKENKGSLNDILEESKLKTNKKHNKNVKSFDELPEEVTKFLRGFTDEALERIENRSYFIAEDGNVYMLPEDISIKNISSLRFSRTGSTVGNIQKGKGFNPHTAFALLCGNESFENSLDLPAHSEYITKYLKGETLVIPNVQIHFPIKKGICMIKVSGHPLGFAKYDGSKFKNLYEKGWRLN